MPVWELAGSNTADFDLASGMTLVRRLMCNWGERYAVAQSLLGTQHPEVSWAWAQRVTIEPSVSEPVGAPYDLANPAQQIIAYPTTPAIVTVEYGPGLWWPAEIPLPPLRNGTALGLRMSSGGEFLLLDGQTARYDDNTSGDPDGPVPPPDSPAARYYVSTAELELSWQFVANPPIGRMQSLKGKVNDSAFLSANPETLLFAGYELEPQILPNFANMGGWKITVRLLHRDIEGKGWNHELRHDGWQRVKMKHGGDVVDRYTKANFSTMFT